MKFYLFKHTVDNSVFGATDEPSGEKLPVLPGNGRWKSFTDFEESGKPRIAFSEQEAKADIELQGYHLTRTEIRINRSSTRPQK